MRYAIALVVLFAAGYARADVIPIGPGTGYCHQFDPAVYGPADKHAWIWTPVRGGGWWCIQYPLGNYANLGVMNDKVVAIRPGRCADVMAYEHSNFNRDLPGAVNHVWDDTQSTHFDSWWRVRVSSFQIRPLLQTPRGEPCP